MIKVLKKYYLLLFILISSCSSIEEKSRISDLIPDSPLVVLNIKNINDLNYGNLNFISKSLNLSFEEIDLLKPESEIIFSFHKSGKNNLKKFVIQKSENFQINQDFIQDTINYNGSNIYKYKSEYFISKVENYIVFSKNKLLVENVLRGATFSKSNDYKNYQKINNSKSKNISLNISENFKELSFNYKKENINNYSNWVQYEFDIENNDINILGLSTRDLQSREINMLSGLNKSKSNILSLIPNNFSEFSRMSFSYDVINNNYNNFKNTSSIDNKKLNSIFKEVKEIAQIKIDNDSILVLNFQNIELENNFENLNILNKYRDLSIYDAKEIKISSFDILNFKLSNNYGFFTLIEKSLIFSNNLATVQNLILNYNNGSVVINDENFLNFLNSIPKKTTFFEILNQSNLKDNIEYPYWFSNYEINENTNYKSIFSTPNIDVKSDKKLNLIFSKKLDSEILTDPKFIYNYNSGENNIMLQDKNLNIIIFDLNGGKILEKKLDSQVISEIYQVDIYKNNRLQFVFLTSKDFIVLDIKGNLVKKIPLINSGSNKFLSIFDYDNNRNYRFIIQDEKSIRMYDSKFNKVKGFKRTKVKSEIKHKIKHLRIMNKDYLVLVDKLGTPLILDRRGNVRIKLPKNFNLGINHFFKNNNGLVTINNLNELVRIELDGKISLKQLSNERNLFAADNKNILFQSNGLLTINNDEFKVPYGNFNDIEIFNSNTNTYFHTRNLDNNQSFLYNKIGRISGFPIYSKSKIDLIFGKNRELITLKGDENEVILYSLN